MRLCQPSRIHVTGRRPASPTQALLAAGVLAALAVSAPAQQQFGNFFLNGFPSSGGACALGDVNGDGQLDIVVGVAGGQNRLYLNDGNGTGIYTDVTAARMPVDTDNSTSVVLGDVDGDRDLDIVFGNGADYTGYAGQQNRLYLNDGTGTFTDVTATQMPTDTDPTSAVVLGDVDGDGDLDLICGNGSLQNPYTPYPAPYSPVDRGVQNRLYLNNGAGTFTDATATHMPADTDPTSAMVLGDVDGDGDPDLVVGNSLLSRWGSPPYLPIPFGVQDRLYLNDGTGRFTDVTAALLPVDSDGTHAVALGDVDGDGDLDLVLGNGNHGRLQTRLYLNNGGVFTDATATQMPVDTDATQAVALADFDGDGDLDLVIGNAGQNRLYLNNGQGAFTDATTRMPVDTSTTISAAVGDLDRDGDLDILFGNVQQNRLISNMQRQLFARAPTIGQTWRLDVYARCGPQGVTDVALPFMALGPAPFPIPIPPFGTIGIDLNQVVTLPLFVVPQPAGLGSLSIMMPNNPWLRGLQVYSQALLIQSPVQTLLTNVVRSVVQ